uniref:THAP-type domain-containing protein n=1 Tax=Trichogramma kaykai TaxID=54128 RepID=A0ABD2X7D9_9HYME
MSYKIIIGSVIKRKDYCTNSSSKGFKMCRFPRRDDQRRQIWIQNVNRDGWNPTANSMLCEMHFADNAWEIRKGKRQLLQNAVPTIFANRVIHQDNLSLPENQEIAQATSHSQEEKEPCDASNVQDQGSFDDVQDQGSFNDTAEESFFEDTCNTPSGVVEDQTSLLQDLSGMILSRSPTSVNVSEDTSEKDGNSPTPLPISKEGCKKCLINEKILKRQQLFLDKMNKLFLRREQAFNRMQKNLNAARQKVRRLEHKLEVSTQDRWATSLKNIFQEDQLKYLTLGYKKVPKWCSDTLLKALKLRFACGTSGYEEILNLNFPFPSVRTLVRKMENLKFKPGCVILEILQFLEIKVNSFQDFYKDCVLVLDEMSITPGSFYDTSTNTFLGTVTLPEHDQSQIATHALVFMLAGLGARWKQIIRFNFTPDSVNGRVFKTIIDEIILKVENIGLRLPTDNVDKNYVYELFDKDEGLELKLAPKLTKQSLNTQDHFAKMKVSNAKKVLSEDVASGLSFLASDLEDERHTTAWFVEFLSKWFTFMCSRNINFSLSYHDDDKFNEAISFLKEVILFFTELKVGAAPKWKPFQTAILISTQTVIDLSQYLLNPPVYARDHMNRSLGGE